MGVEDKMQEREIGGVVYKTHPLPFEEGIKALLRFIRVLSPVLSAAFSQASKSDAVAGVFAALPTVLTDDDVKWFAEKFGQAAWYKGDSEDQWVPLVTKNRPEHFELRYLEYFQWIGFCAEVNFAPFFSGIMNATDGAETLLKKLNLSKGSTPGNG